MKPYNKKNIPLAKSLRNNMTPWERKLWFEFLRYYPVRFQRQKAIGEHIVDFYCAKAQLAVELDGGGHYEPQQMEADERRTEMLKNAGVSVLRICNLDVDKNFSGVCECIDAAVQESLPQSAALTAPSSDGAFCAATQARTIFALGVFDGVHKGHQALLTACRHLAQRLSCKAGVVTFGSHPDSLVQGKAPLLINTIQDRQLLLAGRGIQEIRVLPFDKTLMNMPWQDFLKGLVENGAAGFVCGDDFRFGFRGEGTAEKLAEFCREKDLAWAVVPAQKVNDVTVSSTYIRQLLEAGEVEKAAEFLGHPHFLTGKVQKGRQLGRTIGIPTANLTIPEGVVIPKFGVYACKVIAEGKTYLAVTNVGTRPTVGGSHITVEPWILDFEGDLYGKSVTVEFHHYLRPERKFASLEELQAEIRKNAEKTRLLLQNS